MTDLHTHILPCMDDGANSIETALEMIRESAAQGVSAIALTPHFYADRESLQSFLSRRNDSFKALKEAAGEQIRFILGAECAFCPELLKIGADGLKSLCYEGTDYLLIEPPFVDISYDIIMGIRTIMGNTGLTPVIAHIDRYIGFKGFEQLIDLQIPVQVSAAAILAKGLMSYRAMRLIAKDKAQIVISDCHDTGYRAQNLGKAYELIEKKFGKDFAAELMALSDELAGIL